MMLQFLNQARAWFPEIVLWKVCVCVYVCMYVCMYVWTEHNMLFWIIVVATKLMYYRVSHMALSWHLYYFYFTLMTFHSVSVIE